MVVCPTGIDIRDGSQLECIQCALCIDACNEIMDKIKRPRGLIAYDTIAKQEASARGITHEPVQLLRPRTLLYFAMIALVGIMMLVALWNRTTLELNVQHDRNPPFVRALRGRHPQWLHREDPQQAARAAHVCARAQGSRPVPHCRWSAPSRAARCRSTVPTNTLRELRVFVTVPRDGLAQLRDASTNFAFEVRDISSGQTTRRGTLFQAPAHGERP